MKTIRPSLCSFLLVATSFAGLAAPLCASGPGVEPARPFTGWVFDEGSGSVTIDRFAYELATLENASPAPWGSPGPFAYPLNSYAGFDGIDKRIKVKDEGVLASRPTSSVSAWFRFPTMPTMRQYVLYSERDACEFNIFWVGVELRPGFAPGLTFAVYDTTSPVCGSGFWHTLTHPVVPTDDVWHHVVATLSPAGGMKLYFDGTLVGMLPGVPPYLGGVQGTTTIGHGHTVGSSTYWKGFIDEVGLFGYALTPPEVAWLHAHSLTAMAQWSFDELCFGDSSGTACPCGNNSGLGTGAGCRHSAGAGGAKLTALGSPRVEYDSVILTATELPSGTPVLFFQGTATLAGGAGITFGDGLLCLGGTITRLSVKFANGHFAYMPYVSDLDLSVQGLLPPGGGERFYQGWYRDSADFCTSSTFNLTNAVRIPWEI